MPRYGMIGVYDERILLMLRNALLFLFAAMISSLAMAQDVTTCRAPKGYSYYHYQGLTSKDDSGFAEDKLSNGVFTIKKIGNETFDILYVDSRKTVTSSVADGAIVRLLRRGKADATFITIYSGSAIDLYTIWVDKESRPKFSLILSRGGDSTLLHKSGVLVGDCDPIGFGLLD
jgi:hypothetical protein